MDRSVPPGAALLLDFIRSIEVGTAERAGYDVVYGHNQGKLPKPLTQMTVDEVIDAGRSWTRRWKSSAAGGYQFMNATLKGLKSELGLRGSQLLDPELQDRLGYHLLKRRGYDEFMAGKMTRTEFGKRLAQEWASLPVLAKTKGAHRTVSRGQSYYAGDGLNKSLVAPERVEALLDRVKAAGNVIRPQKPADARKPDPAPEQPEAPQRAPTPAPAGILALLIALLAAIGAWLANLPCSMLGVMCGG